jgi:GDP-L-fucose synthase
MNKDSKILILGANGMVGKTLCSKLKEHEHFNLFTPRSLNLNLLDGNATLDYIKLIEPDYVFMLAAKVGGIMANISQPATFGFDNAMMSLNVINACKEANVKKMLFMGSSCIYPRECKQPMKEEYLLTGPVEPTNEMYALAKIFSLKLCDSYHKQYGSNFISCMPCNIYGENDNFDLKTSHVMSALIKKFHDAKVDGNKSVTVFGTGNARREFIHVEDVANACLFLMDQYNDSSHINVGLGTDITIYELAHLIKAIVGFDGEVIFDTSRPDGMPQKVLDVSKINQLGWSAKIGLVDGIKRTYKWFLKEYGE